MKIPLDLIPNAYNISRMVYEGKLKMSDGARQLASNGRMNLSSAKDYIYVFRYLMDGRKFQRTLNGPSMEFFFESFLRDYGPIQLAKPLSALKKHIEYYEGKQRTHMKLMRAIYNSYLVKSFTPTLITTVEQLLENLENLEYFLTEGDEQQRLDASNLIKDGICFLAYEVEEEIRFAPSRFIGYVNNRIDNHKLNDRKHGTYTTRAIRKILNSRPKRNKELEEKYFEYCNRFGIKSAAKGSFGNERKFWTYRLEKDFRINNELTGEFPEGRIYERKHLARERNSQVVLIAKTNFKNKHRRLFCEVCGFDFANKYGSVGNDYIEGHHTVALKDMRPDYKTKPEEIAMLCGNCHRMAHRRRPWLEMSELKALLKNN